MMATTTEERVSRLEGEYGHLATKADVVEVRVEIADLPRGTTGNEVDAGCCDQCSGRRPRCSPASPEIRRIAAPPMQRA